MDNSNDMAARFSGSRGLSSHSCRYYSVAKIHCVIQDRFCIYLWAQHNDEYFCHFENVCQTYRLTTAKPWLQPRPPLKIDRFQAENLYQFEILQLTQFIMFIKFPDTIFHTNSYGLCETVSYRWDGQKKSCKKEKGMKRNARPYICINKITLVRELDIIYTKLVKNYVTVS